MSFRSFVSTRSLAAAAVVGAAAPALAGAGGPDQPNVIVILADDMGYGDVGPYDHDADGGTPDVTNTPNLDALAAAGVSASQFYVTSPVCSPTRGAMLTGRHHVRAGITGVFGAADAYGLPASEVTIAEALQTAGYRTGLVGKWHLGDMPQFLPDQHGFDEFYGVPYSNDIEPFFILDETGTTLDPSPDQALLTQTFNTEAKQFVTDSHNLGVPFFLWVSYTAPHVPVYVSASFDGVTGRGLYADAIYELDWSVGDIAAHVDSLGLGEDTLIVFLSDNGPWDNTHGPEPGHDPARWVGGSAAPLQGSKATFEEGGVRVPFLARWTGTIPPGGQITTPICVTDLFPTIANLAGAEIPTDRVMDGDDVLGLLTGSSGVEADPQHWFHTYHTSSPNWGTTIVRATRFGRWKVFFDTTPDPLVAYDLVTDPTESSPVFDPAVLSMLSDLARGYQEALGQGLPPDRPRLDRARHRFVTASSSVDANTSREAVDGDFSSYWESESGDAQWIQVDLGSRMPISRVLLTWGAEHGAQYEVKVSNDGSSWTTAATEATGDGGLDLVRVDSIGRYVRVECTASSSPGAGYELLDLAVSSFRSAALPAKGGLDGSY